MASEDGEYTPGAESEAEAVPSLFPILSRAQEAGNASVNPPQDSGAVRFTSFSSFSAPAAAAAASSLFPASATEAGLSQEDVPEWLRNFSFQETLVSAPSAPAKRLGQAEGVVQAGEIPAGADGLQEQVSEDDSDEADDRRQHKRRKRRRRKREEEKRSARHKKGVSYVDEKAIGSLQGSSVERKSAVSAWADSKLGAQKEYYFDIRGDRDNLAFGSLYRMDVANYRRRWTDGATHGAHLSAGKRKFDFTEEDENSFDLEGSLKPVTRYFYPKIVALEKQSNLKRVRIHSPPIQGAGKTQGTFVENAYVSLEVEDEQKRRSEVKESWEDSMNRKTKEFNQLTREKPHDESVWIAFALFQDELVQSAHKKAAIQQAVDKKICILERALEQHPDSEDLLLLYLETCRKRLDTSMLLSKWEQAVRRHPGSYRMWREYLCFHKAQFSQFSASAMRRRYLEALHALSAVCNQLHSKKAGNTASSQQHVDSEQAMVAIFLDLARFEWQTGHYELAIGMFQAQLEFAIFAPPIQLSEHNKQRLFEAFWDSGASRIGEDGALGWALWLEKEEEQLQAVRKREADEEAQDVGGWTGWSEVSGIAEGDGLSRRPPDEELDTTGDDLEDMEEDAMEDEAALLEKLGLSLDLTKEVQVDDPIVWERWSEEETRRGSLQWLPVRKNLGKGIAVDEPDAEDEQLESMVLFEDIRENLFSLETEQARFSLVGQFIDFCEGPLSHWCCTNSVSFKGRWEATESLSSGLLKEFRGFDAGEGNMESEDVFLEHLVGNADWFQQGEGRANFVRNCLKLLRPFCSHHQGIQDLLLKFEGIATAAAEGHVKNTEISTRALAKKLLKTHRQDHRLLGVYGRTEASFGNIEVARRVFDTTLTSLPAISMEAQLDAPILYLSYVEIEMAQAGQDIWQGLPTGNQRVLHLLCSAGAGGTFSPFSESGGVPGAFILRAQRGYSEQLHMISQSCHGPELTERGGALITCAAMFEHVRSGWEAASSIFEDSLAMNLPVKRQSSVECEKLFVRYAEMLEGSKQLVKPALVRRIALRGLVQYPLNPRLLGVYVRHSGLISNLRRFFDDEMDRTPSTILGLFAISCELGRPTSGHRIHGFLERALERSPTEQSVVLWRLYLAYELQVARNPDAARRVFFRAIHACPWSKSLWMDGFKKLKSVLSAKEQSDFLEIMRDKDLRIRTDIYEILLQEAEHES